MAQTASPVVGCVVLLLSAIAGVTAQGAWTTMQGTYNWRKATGKSSVIDAGNAHLLTKLFSVNTSGADVSATPTVARGKVFFPDWHGFLWSVDAQTGQVLWRVDLKAYIPGNATYNSLYLSSRTSPAIDLVHEMVIVGMQANLNLHPEAWSADPPHTAYVLAINMNNGQLVWKQLLSDNGWAVITAAPSILYDAVYVGTSSNEELAADGVTGYVATFRGSLAKLSLKTGRILWQTYMAPDFAGPESPTYFPGNAVWGSCPVFDSKRKLVYIATGNNYASPPSAVACVNASMTTANGHVPDPVAAANCGQNIDGNWYDAVVALSIYDGSIAWAKRFSYFDIWTDSCGPYSAGGTCAIPYSDDFDFAQAPLYLPHTRCPNGTVDLLIAAQKSGSVYAINAATSALVWSTFTGSGDKTGGGAMWGSAYDGESTVFVPNGNSAGINVTLINSPSTSDPHVTAAYASALDVCTGAIKWQAASPNKQLFYGGPTYSGYRANGIVFFPTLVADGAVYGFKATDGSLVAEFRAGPASLAGGPSIVDGKLYIGTGYRYGAPGSAVVAYSVPSA